MTKESQRRTNEVPKAVMNEYGTFIFVFHKMFQCWADDLFAFWMRFLLMQRFPVPLTGW